MVVCIPLLFINVVTLIVLLTLIISIADDSSGHLTISSAGYIAILVFDISCRKDTVHYIAVLTSARYIKGMIVLLECVIWTSKYQALISSSSYHVINWPQ